MEQHNKKRKSQKERIREESAIRGLNILLGFIFGVLVVCSIMNIVNC